MVTEFNDLTLDEKKEGMELLSAIGSQNDKTKYLGDNPNVFMNQMSGYIFLSDDDYNVAMLDGDILRDFLNCPECSNEGFQSDLFKGSQCCKDYVRHIR